MNPALHSSAKHDWPTPDSFLDLVRKIDRLLLDPCTTPDNPVGALLHIAPPLCGIAISWWGLLQDAPGIVFVNPPYGRQLADWVRKCVVEAGPGCEIVLLVPARTDTAWYGLAKRHASASCEWRGRLKFKGARDAAPFPSAVFYFGKRPHLFAHVFQEHGRVQVMR